MADARCLARDIPSGEDSAVALSNAARTLRARIEVSIGELLDRISILEIKLDRLPREFGPAIRRELAAAHAERDRVLPLSESVLERSRELYAVNALLWDVEEEIRACERRRNFGPRFIELARAVYVENDRRAALKRRIDELVGSALCELKSHTLPEP